MVQYSQKSFSQIRIQRKIFWGYRALHLSILGGLAIMAGIALAVTLGVQHSYNNGEPLKGLSFIYEISPFGFSFAQIFFGTAAILFICSEWDSGFVFSTYGSTQRTIGYVAGKVLWPVLATALGVGVMMIILVPLENMLLASTPYSISLMDAMVWRQIGIQVFTTVCSVCFAAGLALVFRRSAPTLGFYIAITLIAPIVFGLIPLEVSEMISRWLPNNVYGYLISADPSLDAEKNNGLLVLAAALYGVVAVTAGGIRLRKSVV